MKSKTESALKWIAGDAERSRQDAIRQAKEIAIEMQSLIAALEADQGTDLMHVRTNIGGEMMYGTGMAALQQTVARYLATRTVAAIAAEAVAADATEING